MLTNTARSFAVSHFVYAGLSLPIILNLKKYMGELFQHRETFLVSILKGQLVNKFRDIATLIDVLWSDFGGTAPKWDSRNMTIGS